MTYKKSTKYSNSIQYSKIIIHIIVLLKIKMNFYLSSILLIKFIQILFCINIYLSALKKLFIEFIISSKRFNT